MIEILIPTFNRAEFLKKNILDLNGKIINSNLQDQFRILVSNNCSTDNTAETLFEIEKDVAVPIITFHQKKNIGLEPNALFLLEKATADYVMYLGDDDYIPKGYLEFIDDKTKSEGVDCIIPGFSALYPGNIIKQYRNATFNKKKYPPGFATLCKLSNFGHQLSGLVTKRKDLYRKYMEKNENRNIYPFVFFVSCCMLRGETYYAPMYQVLVSQGNTKDWCYDDSGLLIDIFKNYKILFPSEPFKEAWACLSFARIQSWRLRVGKNPLSALKAFKHLIKSVEVSPLIKMSLPFIYSYCYVEKSFFFFKRRLLSGSVP
jgi:glycosyltransferase involved in cell wall biosynthesis